MGRIWPQLRVKDVSLTTSVSVKRIGGFNMSSGPDWRSAAAYTYLDNLSPSELAWEFLRRNPEYRRDHQVTAGHADEAGELPELLIRRWGLPFPDRSGSAS